MSTTASDGIHDGMVRAEPARQIRSDDPRDRALPDELARRYARQGDRLLFPDGAIAMEDRGTRLVALTENPQVARDMVEIAQARGWTRLSSYGSDVFRGEIARASARWGLDVTNDERAARLPSRRADEGTARVAQSGTQAAPPLPEEQPQGEVPASSSSRTRGRTGPSSRRVGDVIHGRLVEAGTAPYRFDPANARSYYVRIETATGTRDLWGAHLKEALADSWTWPQPGDRVGVQYLGTMKVPAARDAQTDSPARRRNLWRIEKASFYEARERDAQAIRKGELDLSRPESMSPDARSAAAILRAAAVFAADRINATSDRERFVNAVRSTLAVTTERGDWLPALRLRDPTRRTEPRVPTTTPDRSSPTR